jgi:hypothetical protein
LLHFYINPNDGAVKERICVFLTILFSQGLAAAAPLINRAAAALTIRSAPSIAPPGAMSIPQAANQGLTMNVWLSDSLASPDITP